MTLSTLAPELLDQILSYLEHEDLSSASLVCRDWLGPSRHHYWTTFRLNIIDKSAEMLAAVLREGTTVPHKIRTLRIDERDDFGCRNADDTAKWQANLSKIMSHFSTVSRLRLSCLDLSKFPAEKRQHILLPSQMRRALNVSWLMVERPEEATSFILDQPNIRSLSLGCVILAKKKKGLVQGIEENAVSESVVRLRKLEYLCLYSCALCISWSHVVPWLAKAQLVDLKTLIVDCHDRKLLGKLIRAAAPALRSLAIRFKQPGDDNISLSKTRSLKNLGFSLLEYPDKEYVLDDTVNTICTAPPTVEQVFINIGPKTVKAGKESSETAASQWEALDAALARLLPQLKRVTIVTHSFDIIPPQMGVGPGSLADEWKRGALGFAKAQLSACESKVQLEVKDVMGHWINGAFADVKEPE